MSEYGRGGINYLLTRDSVKIDTLNTQFVADPADPLSVLAPGAMAENIVPGSFNGVPGNNVTANLCDFVIQSLTPTCESRGDFVTSLVGFSLSFDTRDDPITPRRGWRGSASVGVAGLGGDVNYYQTELNGAWYHPIIGDFIGSLKGRVGYIDGWSGDNVRLSDRFFEGASTFRGFEVAGVGPRYLSGSPIIDPTTGDLLGVTPRVDNGGNIVGQAIGAKAYAIGTAEILLPLPLPDQYGIRASLFSDFGTVGLVDESTKALNNNPGYFVDTDGDGIGDLAPIQDDLALRVTAGVSVSWDSPFGPVRFDFAKIIRKEEYDQTEGFRFSAGTNF